MMAEDILAIFGVCCLSVALLMALFLVIVTREQLR